MMRKKRFVKGETRENPIWRKYRRETHDLRILSRTSRVFTHEKYNSKVNMWSKYCMIKVIEVDLHTIWWCWCHYSWDESKGQQENWSSKKYTRAQNDCCYKKRIHRESLSHILDKIGRLLPVAQLLICIYAASSAWCIL